MTHPPSPFSTVIFAFFHPCPFWVSKFGYGEAGWAASQKQTWRSKTRLSSGEENHFVFKSCGNVQCVELNLFPFLKKILWYNYLLLMFAIKKQERSGDATGFPVNYAEFKILLSILRKALPGIYYPGEGWEDSRVLRENPSVPHIGQKKNTEVPRKITFKKWRKENSNIYFRNKIRESWFSA